MLLNYSRPHARTLAVLLVEDNPGDAHLFEVAAREAGASCSVTIAATGDAALALLAGGQFRPELVVLDLNLPGKSGFEVLAEMKSSPQWRRLPVIVFSSSERSEDIRRAYDLQASCYVRKPVDWESLVEFLRALKAFWCSFALVPQPPPPAELRPRTAG